MNGHFTFPSGETLSGSLSLQGSDSALSVWGASSELKFSEADVITGILDNQKPIALMGCIPVSVKTSLGPNGPSRSYEIFPHHVVIGNSEISYADDVITKVEFEFDDALVLFKNEAIDILSPDPDQLGEFVSSQNTDATRPVEVGKHPVVSYYTDANQGQICSVETAIGKVSAHNQVQQFSSDREGAGITNRIVVAVQFEKPTSIPELQSRIETLLRFLGTIIGRPQNLLETKILVTNEPDVIEGFPKYCIIHFHSLPQPKRRLGGRSPHPQDVLINAGSQSAVFSRVLRNWLERDQDPAWQTARRMFFFGWSQGRSYDAARLMSAANMFDHLPSSEFRKQAIEQILQSPIKAFREFLESIPQSEQRNSLLGALGRITKPTLKPRIRCRSTRLANGLGQYIPDIAEITDFAVNCRNLYTHGSGSASRATKRLGPLFTVFLTNTLEFIFAVSDLIEAGWDSAEWCNRQKLASHPFYEYIYTYAQNLDDYRKELEDFKERERGDQLS